MCALLGIDVSHTRKEKKEVCVYIRGCAVKTELAKKKKKELAKNFLVSY